MKNDVHIIITISSKNEIVLTLATTNRVDLITATNWDFVSKLISKDNDFGESKRA